MQIGFGIVVFIVHCSLFIVIVIIQCCDNIIGGLVLRCIAQWLRRLCWVNLVLFLQGVSVETLFNLLAICMALSQSVHQHFHFTLLCYL